MFVSKDADGAKKKQGTSGKGGKTGGAAPALNRCFLFRKYIEIPSRKVAWYFVESVRMREAQVWRA